MKTRRKALALTVAATAATLAATAVPALGVSFPSSTPTTGSGWNSTGPHDVAAAPDGSAWFIERGDPAAVGRYIPGGGVSYELNSPTASALDAGILNNAKAEAIAVSATGQFVYIILSDTAPPTPNDATSIVRINTQVGSMSDSDANPQRLIRCPVPSGNTGPTGIVALPNGEVAFSTSNGNSVVVWSRAAQVTPNPDTICSPSTNGNTLSSTWRAYDRDVNDSFGEQPASIDFNPVDGKLYATLGREEANGQNGLMVVDPTKVGSIADTYINLTGFKPSDGPADFKPGDIAINPSTNTAWFVNTDPTGSGPAYKAVSVPLGGGTPVYHAVGGNDQNSQPIGIAVDSQGAVWYADQRTTQDGTSLGRIGPGQPTFSEFAVPSSYAGPRDIAFLGLRGFVAAKFSGSLTAPRGAIGDVLLDAPPPPPSAGAAPVAPPLIAPIVTRKPVKVTVALKPKFALVRKGGQTFLKVTGTVTKSQAGRLVILERKAGRRTVRVGVAKVTKAGRLNKMVPLRVTTGLKVRARMVGTATARPVATAFRAVGGQVF